MAQHIAVSLWLTVTATQKYSGGYASLRLSLREILKIGLIGKPKAYRKVLWRSHECSAPMAQHIWLSLKG